jgi:MYXO-CTERM domain-containing protein
MAHGQPFPRPARALVRARPSVALVLGLASLLAAAPASGHGRFPASNAIAFDPTDADHAVVRMTYGFYDNELPEGADPTFGWRWLCSAALGYDANKEDPAFTFAGDRLLVGTFDGLVSSTPDRCGYELVPATKGRYVVDLAALPSADAPAAKSPVLALASNGTGEDTFDVRLFELASGASAWQPVETTLPPDFLAVSLAAAPSKDDPLRWGSIYLSGRDGTLADGYHAVVLRSDDGGATWSRFEVPGLDGLATLPYLQAASPTESLTVFAAGVLDEPPTRKQTNLVSRDGGATWTTYFEANELLPGLAVAPDGSKVAFGGEKAGLLVAPIAALEDPAQAKKLQKTRVACLSWQESGLYACGNAFVDGFSVGRSEDGGVSFEPFSKLTSACGPRECAPGTTIGDTCGPLWAIEAKEIVAPMTCTPEPPPPVDDGGCAVAFERDSDPLVRHGTVALLVAGLLASRRRRR